MRPVPTDDQLTSARPIAPGSRDSTEKIHQHLRASILSGELPAGIELSQARVAKDFQVSRGPVREAFRLLQREELIEAQVNHRARVTGLSLSDVEHVYALRIVNEALALAVSVPRFSGADLDTMDELVTAITAAHGQGFGSWERRHREFHDLLLVHAGERMRSSVARWAEHSERYRRVYLADAGGGWAVGALEHAELATACRAGDTVGATGMLARHLSRAALTLVAAMDPTHEPALLRAAVRQVASPGGLAERNGRQVQRR